MIRNAPNKMQILIANPTYAVKKKKKKKQIQIEKSDKDDKEEQKAVVCFSKKEGILFYLLVAKLQFLYDSFVINMNQLL